MMNPAPYSYQNEIDRLRASFGYDFVSIALAQSAADGFVLTWQYASGNLNDRYKRIVLRSGKGIAGNVFKTGKPMLVANVHEELDPHELYHYPIVVSERLQSLGAVPLYEYDRVAGVLLAGYREAGRMTRESFLQLQQWLNGRFGAFAIKELPFS